MKKIILLFILLSSLSFSSQIYNFEFEQVDLLNIVVNDKYDGYRYFEGTLKNKTDQKIIILNFEIKYRDENARKNTPYSSVGKINIYSLGPQETTDFITYVDVTNIEGLDFKIEISNIILRW